MNFKLLLDNEEMIRKNIFLLKKIYKGFDTDYKSYIKFNMEGFFDVNILEMIEKINEEEKNKFEFGIEEINKEKMNFIEIDDDIEDNSEQEEINNKSEVINFFQLISPNKKEIKEEKEKDIKQEENKIKKNIYIKMKDIDKFNLDNKKAAKIGNKLLKKFLPSKNNYKEISKDLLLPININNMFFSLKTKESKEKIEFKNILINDDLKQLNDIYKKNIILDFLNILIGHNNYINAKNLMTIDDYTSILLSFVKNIEKKISEVNKNKMKEKEYKNYILRLEKINSSMKLFHILFLNCFDNDSNNNLFDDFFSLKVQTMRKKRLIEWCISQESNYINKTDLININKNKKKEILTKQLMSFGQIKTAIKVNKTRNLFINSKLSNLSENCSNKTLSYFIKGQKGINEINKSFISYKADFPENSDDKINNTWISFLLQSLLYKEKGNEYIIKSINLIDEKMKAMEETSKPYINNVFKLNYVLLKIYEKIITGVKDIKSFEEYLNMLCNNNLIWKNNVDHFCQYIISYLLTKIIPIIIPELKDDNSLHKKNYFLLNQIISEIISVEVNDNNNEENKIMNLIIIMKLLYVTNINNKIKQKIFVEIISRQNLISIDSFWEIYNKENIPLINDLNKEYINAMYYLNNNDLLKAYKSLVKSKKYKSAIDVYLKYFFSLIKEEKININFVEILDNLKEIFDIVPEIFNNEFYIDFIKFISYNVKREETSNEDIIELLNKFLYDYYGKGEIIYLDEKSHGYIIKTLCGILLEKNKENKGYILCGDLRINEMENVLYEDKCDLLNGILKDLIEHKNKHFSLLEVDN